MNGEDGNDEMFAIISKEASAMIENLKGLKNSEQLGMMVLGFLNQIVMMRVGTGIPLEEITEAMEYLITLLRNITRVLENVEDKDSKEINWDEEFKKEFRDA